jgi:Zn-dependent alcohol dehydrogenase
VLAPSRAATLVVAALLAASAAIVVGGVRGWDPRLVFRLGGAGIAVVLFARAVGDRRYIGFFKRIGDTEFARRDTWLYSPLCLVLAAVISVVATVR